MHFMVCMLALFHMPKRGQQRRHRLRSLWRTSHFYRGATVTIDELLRDLDRAKKLNNQLQARKSMDSIEWGTHDVIDELVTDIINEVKARNGKA